MKTFYFTKKISRDTQITRWGYVEVIAETSAEARKLMVKHFDLNWGFEYNELEQVHPLDRNFITTLKTEKGE